MGMFDFLGDVTGGIFGAKAAGAEMDAAQKAMALQQGVYGQNSRNYNPYMNAGDASLSQLMSGLQNGSFQANLNPSQIANDPGYQFRMQQGMQALQRSAAAKGGLMGGGFSKGLADYSQGLASQEYNNAWQRNFQQGQANYGNLYQLAGLGENATNQQANLGQNYANSMSSLWGAYGSAQAGQDQAFGNAISGGLRDLGGMGGSMAQGGGGGGFSLGSLAGLL